MALNSNIKNLILSIARDNNIQRAKQYIKIIVENETAVCNESFCNTVKGLLSQPSLNIIELPPNLKDMLTIEDVSVSFRPKRYWVSPREKELEKEILSVHKASQILMSAGVNYLNAALLYGGTGTGKTQFGRYLAWSMNKPFAYINFGTLIDSHLGGTGKNINLVFDFIQKTPTVLMMNELDAICMARGHSKDGAGREMDRVTITLMQCLDKLRPDTILLAATNRFDDIDDAVKRRIPLHHEVKSFDETELFQMLSSYLDDVNSCMSPPLSYDPEELKAYAKASVGQPQAKVIGELVRAMAKAIQNNESIHI